MATIGFKVDVGLIRRANEAVDQVLEQGSDPHAAAASVLFGVRLEDVTPMQRAKAKNLNFVKLYGSKPTLG